MNEIESAKEAVVERPRETQKEHTKETPKASKIEKFYNVGRLLQNIFLATAIISILSGFALFFTHFGLEILIFYNILYYILLFSILITFLISLLFIIIGIPFYFSKNITKKLYGKKFISRGIIILIPIFIIFYVYCLAPQDQFCLKL